MMLPAGWIAEALDPPHAIARNRFRLNRSLLYFSLVEHDLSENRFPLFRIML